LCGGRLHELGEKEREGAAAKERTRRGGGGGLQKKRGRREGWLGFGGGRVCSHPSDRDQRPKPAPTFMLPTPVYKSKKVLLFH
jgi:hypothetical protein